MLVLAKKDSVFSDGRAKFLFGFFLVWGAFMSLRLAEIGIINRDKNIALCEKLARRKGVIQAPRGRILDRNGVVLAWSERRYDLIVDKQFLRNSQVSEKLKRIKDKIESEGWATKRDMIFEDATTVQIRNLSPEAMDYIREVAGISKAFKISPRLERKTVDYPEVRKLIGQTIQGKGGMRGISGMEEEWDIELSGMPGEYSVMLDRFGKIIEGTFKIEKPVTAGTDVNLELSLSEIIQLQKDATSIESDQIEKGPDDREN